MERSDATRMRSSGVNLSFCPGTSLKNAPHGESPRNGSQPWWSRLARPVALLRAKLREPDRIQTCARADGSTAAGAIPAKRRAARRNAQSPGRHTASRWDQTGNSPQTEKTNTFCKNAGPAARCARAGSVEQTLAGSLLYATASSFLLSLPRLRATLQQPKQIRGQRGKRRFGHGALWVNHDVPSRGYLSPMAAHDLPQAPPDTIAHHRAAQRLLDADAKAALRQSIGAKEHCEVGT